MSTAIDGLVSGLNTTTIISQLMQLEAAPQTSLKTAVTKTGSIVAALQALNTKLASLGDSAKAAATATSWQAVTAASTATSVTASAAAGAQPSSLTFSVGALATRQTSVSAGATDLASLFGGPAPATLTLATGSGATASVAAIDLTGVTDLAGLASAINTADTGVTATLVKVSATQSRLQLTGKATGTGAAFDLYAGAVTAAQVQGGSAPAALLGRTGATAITAAADASITLWQGTGAQQVVTSASNAFTGLLTGVDFTLSTAEAAPVTVTVGRNDAALKTLASGLVTNLTTVLAEITSRTKSASTTAADGRVLVTGGILSGDSAVRSMQQSIVTAATDPIGGRSPSTVGIVVGKDGTITFDEAKFTAALAADPANVQNIVSGLAARVQTVATNLSDPTTGSISLKIKGQQSYITSLNDQVSNWDYRLALRRTALEKQYAGLEVALGKLKDQSSWLTSQLSTSSTG